MNNKLNLIHLVITALLIQTPLLKAEIYTWVDDAGKKHFSDVKPNGVKVDTKEIKSATPSGVVSETGIFNTKKANKLIPIKFSGKGSSRMIQLETFVANLAASPGGIQEVGRTFRRGDCSKKSRKLYWDRQYLGIFDLYYKKLFNDALSENGYAVKSLNKPLFGGLLESNAELSISAEVVDVQVNLCDKAKRSSYKNEIDVQAYMKIKWTVFDNLDRRVIYDLVTEGSHSGRYRPEKDQPRAVGEFNAFNQAVINMLADKRISELFTSADAPIVRTASYKKNTTVIDQESSLKFEYGAGNQGFTDVIASLKRATVTIRTAGGHGSGFLITKDGYVITNSHVISKAKQVIVVLGQIQLRADVIRDDARRDVALLKIREFSGEALKISRNIPREGATIYVIGTPLDEKLSHSVTRGIISAKRVRQGGKKFYQTDASINPGNSGGPVFDENGEVIGLAVSGLVNRTGSSLNINFLIPIEDAFSALDIAKK